jgi:hypothetical protein
MSELNYPKYCQHLNLPARHLHLFATEHDCAGRIWDVVEFIRMSCGRRSWLNESDPKRASALREGLQGLFITNGDAASINRDHPILL